MKKILAFIVATVLVFGSTVTASAAESKYKGRTDFMWGVTSHDYMYASYGNMDPEEYIKATAETGAKLFRIGFNQQLDEAGLEYLDKCVKLCDEYGMDILVLMRFVTYELDMIDLNTIYFEMIAERYNGKNGHGFIDYFEVGAEEDCRMLNNKYPVNGPNGDMVDHYYETDLVKWQQLYASCIKGIRNVSTAKVVIDFSHLHYAPLLYMHERGLDFDIIGMDWYTNMGPLSRVLDPVLEKFSHDIIITETNLWAGPETDQENLDEYSLLFDFMDEAYATPRVKSLIIYELKDEPEFNSDPNAPFTQEAHFGLCKSEGSKISKISGYKPIYYEVQRLWGGGPVKKTEVIYDVPKKEEDSNNNSSSVESTVSNPIYNNNTQTENSNSTVTSVPDTIDTSSVTELEPQRNIEVKQLVTTTTVKVFPWVWFAVGTVVILALGAFCLVFFVIKPPFVKKLFKKKA